MSEKVLTLGSLFDGSGTALLCARMLGMKPLWASEIEPYAIRVTQKNFPDVPHVGDITKLKGRDLPPVDVIVGGSPCQSLSFAGKREGLIDGVSNLFFQQIRVINEMRDATNGIYPRFAVWENVYGAFSSSNGEDFRCVLESFARIKDDTVTIPRPKAWNASGGILGDGWSLGWRTVDAQYFHLAQRRLRVYLVADFNGGSAGEILFKRESLSRDFEPCGAIWEKLAGYSE